MDVVTIKDSPTDVLSGSEVEIVMDKKVSFYFFIFFMMIYIYIYIYIYI